MVVVVVVVVDVVEDDCAEAEPALGATEVVGVLEPAVVPAPGVVTRTVVVVGTAVTEICCDAAAGAYWSLPACDALIRQEPGDKSDTTPAEIEQTDEELPAIDTVGAREASLVTDTVYVPPTNGEAGGDDWNVND